MKRSKSVIQRKLDCVTYRIKEVGRNISELHEKVNDLYQEKNELEKELEELGTYHQTHRWAGVHADRGSNRVNLALGCYTPYPDPFQEDSSPCSEKKNWIKNWGGDNHGVAGNQDGPATLSLPVVDMRILVDMLNEAIKVAESRSDSMLSHKCDNVEQK